MENKEMLTYALKRKANGNVKELVSFDQLQQISFESGDRICAQDGKEKWYYSEKFQELYMQPSDKVERSKQPIQVPENPREQKQTVADPVNTNAPPRAVDETKQAERAERPKAAVYFWGSALVAAFLTAWVLSGYIDTPSKVSTQFETGQARQQIMQNELETILLQGVRLARVNGDHQAANIKFSQVRQILSSEKQIQMDSVNKYIDQFKGDGDKLCSGFKTASVIEVANEYYKHASILSGNSQTICK